MISGGAKAETMTASGENVENGVTAGDEVIENDGGSNLKEGEAIREEAIHEAKAVMTGVMT